MNDDRLTVPVLLCGGAGTRLWPLSNIEWPKQLLPLVSSETMLQATAKRLAPMGIFSPPLVVTANAYAVEVERQLVQASVRAKLIVEPCPRNTAPAIALAALDCPPDALLIVMPCDQVIGDLAAFHEAVERATGLAREGWLVTFGVRPTRPETGYGYMKRRTELTPGVFEIEEFTEKPDLATAETFLREGLYDWNAGIFLFRAEAYLAALKAFAPEVVEAASAALKGGRVDGNRIFPDRAPFARSPSISIDHAVMEKADRIAVAPVNMNWSDIGSWEALYEVCPKDSEANVCSGKALAIDSRGCLLRTTGSNLVVIGVQDLVVVSTGDTVLVVPRAQSQRVRQVADKLAEPEC